MQEKKTYRNIWKHKCLIDTPKNTAQVLIQNFLKSIECFPFILNSDEPIAMNFHDLWEMILTPALKEYKCSFCVILTSKIHTCLSLSLGINNGNGIKRNIMKMKFGNKIYQKKKQDQIAALSKLNTVMESCHLKSWLVHIHYSEITSKTADA